MELAAKQLESVKDQFTRLTAEYDNYRKRTTREKDGIYQDAKAETIKAFLAVYDNLERAAAAGRRRGLPPQKGTGDDFPPGARSYWKSRALRKSRRWASPSTRRRMNAVMHIEDEAYGENVVSQVFQAGFMLGGKVLRHAVVQVAN